MAGETSDAGQAGAAQGGSGRAILVSTWQIEGPFLLEWVAYHRAIGFDEIILPGHEHGDGAPELLAALAAMGWVRVVDCAAAPGSLAPCLMAGAAPGSGDWVILLGADEYLNIHVGSRTVQSLIAHLGTARAMLIAARLFGDGGQETYPGRTLAPEFTQAAVQNARLNNLVRTFYAHGPEVQEAAEHRPRLAEGQGWAADQVLTAADRPINAKNRPNRRWLEGAARSFSGIDRSDFGWVAAQVNTYRVRSPEIFALRQRAAQKAAPARRKAEERTRAAEALYTELNLNDQEDRSILHWQGATDALIAEAARQPAVATALALIEERLKENLADLSTEADPAANGAEAEDAAQRTAADFVPKMWFPEPVKAFVQERYQAAECILEYGSGGSTVFAARETRARVLSIESDRKWAASLTAYLVREGLNRPDVVVKWADIGPTRDWGVPREAKLWGRFQRYPMLPWQDPAFSPDLVLIDGRFRAGCLAATLLHCKHPTTVLIDDYANRKGYHMVEALVPITRRIGHMACFEITPQAFTNRDFAQMLPWFFSWE